LFTVSGDAESIDECARESVAFLSAPVAVVEEPDPGKSFFMQRDAS
jgi:hypothetical protein